MDSVKRMMKLEMLELKNQISTVEKKVLEGPNKVLEGFMEKKMEGQNKKIEDQNKKLEVLNKLMEKMMGKVEELLLHQQRPETGGTHLSGGSGPASEIQAEGLGGIQAEAAAFSASVEDQHFNGGSV
jgi:DNA helicase IV